MGCSCGTKKPAYYKKLNLLFKKDKEAAANYQEKDFSEKELTDLTHHVSKSMKGVIDYLATNQHAIVNVGQVLSKYAQSRSHLEVMISILALMFIVQNLNKYKMGANSLKKMIREKKMKKIKKKEYKETFVRDMAEQSQSEHLLKFEDILMESVIFLLSGGDGLLKSHKINAGLVLSAYLSNIDRVTNIYMAFFISDRVRWKTQSFLTYCPF